MDFALTPAKRPAPDPPDAGLQLGPRTRRQGPPPLPPAPEGALTRNARHLLSEGLEAPMVAEAIALVFAANKELWLKHLHNVPEDERDVPIVLWRRLQHTVNQLMLTADPSLAPSFQPPVSPPLRPGRRWAGGR